MATIMPECFPPATFIVMAAAAPNMNTRQPDIHPSLGRTYQSNTARAKSQTNGEKKRFHGNMSL
jgi:hypothetical protein